MYRSTKIRVLVTALLVNITIHVRDGRKTKQATQIGLHVDQGHGGLSKISSDHVTARTAEGSIKLMTLQFSKRARRETIRDQ